MLKLLYTGTFFFLYVKIKYCTAVMAKMFFIFFQIFPCKFLYKVWHSTFCNQPCSSWIRCYTKVATTAWCSYFWNQQVVKNQSEETLLLMFGFIFFVTWILNGYYWIVMKSHLESFNSLFLQVVQVVLKESYEWLFIFYVEVDEKGWCLVDKKTIFVKHIHAYHFWNLEHYKHIVFYWFVLFNIFVKHIHAYRFWNLEHYKHIVFYWFVLFNSSAILVKFSYEKQS